MVRTPAAPRRPSIRRGPPHLSHEAIREAVASALHAPSPDGDLRAFALGDLTCVVRWRPAGTTPFGSSFHHADMRVRRGDEAVEHETTLSDLSMLARWCEHHLAFFDRALAAARSPLEPSGPPQEPERDGEWREALRRAVLSR